MAKKTRRLIVLCAQEANRGAELKKFKTEPERISFIEELVSRRIRDIQESATTNRNGQQIINTDIFCRLIDFSEKVVGLKTSKGIYRHKFLDGECAEVKVTIGKRGAKEFSFEDSVSLLRKILEKEYGLILVAEIASETGVSAGALTEIFRKKDWKLKIKIEGKEHTIELRQGAIAPEGGKIPRYMIREHYELFRKWLDKNYDGKRDLGRTVDCIIPKGYIITSEAADILGESTDYVNSRLKSGTIPGKKLRGIWIAKETDIEEFKKKREELKPPEGSIQLKGEYEEIGFSSAEAFYSSLKLEGKKRYARIRDSCGTTRKIPVYKDIDNELWIGEKEFKELVEIANAKEEYMSKEETARLMDIALTTLSGYYTKGTRMINYKLIDGNTQKIRCFFDGNGYRFNKNDVEKAKTRNKEISSHVAFYKEIEQRTGLIENAIKHLKERMGTIEFTLNGKRHLIKFKNGKNKKIFLYSEEVESLKLWLDITGRTHIPITDYRIRARKDAERFRIEGRRLILSEQEGLKLALQLDRLNGQIYVPATHVELVVFYRDLNSPQVPKRVEAIKRFITNMDGDSFVDVKLAILESMLATEKDSRVLGIIRSALKKGGDYRANATLLRINHPELLVLTTESINQKEFAEIVGIPRATFMCNVKNGEYVHVFVDGEIVRIRKGENGFDAEDALKLKDRIEKEGERIVLLSQIAKGTGISADIIRQWFDLREGEMEISIGKKLSSIELKEGTGSRGKQKLYYMTTGDYELFKKWAAKNYQRVESWNSGGVLDVPQGYVTTVEAAKILGYVDSETIRSKIDSGKPPAEFMEDGRAIIKLEEILRMKEEKDAAESELPVKRVRITRLYEEDALGITDDGLEHLVLEKEEKKYFKVKDYLGNEHTFRIYSDYDAYRWIDENDFSEAVRIHEEKKEKLIGEKEAAKELSVAPNTMKSYADPEKKVFEYPLPDSSITAIRYILDGKERRVNKEDVAAAKKKREELLADMKFVEDIATEFGLSNKHGKQFMDRHQKDGVLEFTINGKKHRIEIKYARGNRTYITASALAVLSRWFKMKKIITHATLHGELCKEDYILEKLTIDNGRIIVYKRNGTEVFVPIEEADGIRYVSRKYAGLVEFCLDITSRYTRIRKRAMEELSASELKNDDNTTIRLLMVREREKTEDVPEVKEAMNSLFRRAGVTNIINRAIADQALIPKKEILLSEVLRDHPRLLKLVETSENGVRYLPLAMRFRVIVPVKGSNGAQVISQRGLQLLNLYLTLFNRQNENGINERALAAVDFLETQYSEKDVDGFSYAALWLVRSFATQSMGYVSLDEMDKLEELGNENDKPLLKLFAMLEKDKFMRVFRRGYDSIDSPYFLSNDPCTTQYNAGEEWMQAVMETVEHYDSV